MLLGQLLVDVSGDSLFGSAGGFFSSIGGSAVGIRSVLCAARCWVFQLVIHTNFWAARSYKAATDFPCCSYFISGGLQALLLLVNALPWLHANCSLICT